jgi:hypothetical protein
LSVYGIPLRALPALVPIGIIVIAVNWREFQLTKQERAMTAALGVVCLLVISASLVAASKERERAQLPAPAPQSGTADRQPEPR